MTKETTKGRPTHRVEEAGANSQRRNSVHPLRLAMPDQLLAFAGVA